MTEPHDWHERQETTSTAEGGRCLTEHEGRYDNHPAVKPYLELSREIRRRSDEITRFVLERIG